MSQAQINCACTGWKPIPHGWCGARRLHRPRGARAATAVVVACVVLVGGCGEDTGQPEVVLRVANWGGAQVESDFVRLERTFEREFEEAHPGVDVRIEQIPGHGQYAPKLLMMHVAGSMPDVIQFDASSGAVFIDNGVLRDLVPFIKADQSFDLDNYFETVTATARRGDAIYTIPLR